MRVSRSRVLLLPHPSGKKGSSQALAWALLLAGWVGIGGLAQVLAAGPMAAFAVISGWLLALGVMTGWLSRCPPRPLMHRSLSVSAGVLAAVALPASTQGGGVLMLLPALLAWAALAALAWNVVRASGDVEPAGPPAGPAAVGALLAWACLGDIGDLRSLVAHMAVLALGAALLLTALAPSRAGRGSPRRAVGVGCSPPAWTRLEWRTPRRWPLQLSALAMLPMMSGLPWMLSLCRSDGVSAQAVLGCHLAAMFLPAWWVSRHRSLVAHAPALCAALLVLGAIDLLFGPRASAWWILAATHGAAWSIAWAARPGAADAPASPQAPWRRAAINALCCLALGTAVASSGFEALAVCHIALGAAAAASVGVVALRRVFRDASPRRLYDASPIDTH